ncbi:hypothetical protein GQ457_17G009070 [Hibiscus cannabinus]
MVASVLCKLVDRSSARRSNRVNHEGYRFGRLERSFGSSGKVKTDFSVLLESVSVKVFQKVRFQLLQEGPETFREGSKTFSLMIPKPCPKVSKPWTEFSVRTERFRNLDPRFRNLSRRSICKFQKCFQKSYFGPELARWN